MAEEAAFAYLIRMFPQTSETFIANEILRVERTGLPLRIYSYRRPVEDVQHEVVRQITTPVSYLPDPLWKHLPVILSGAARTIRRAPLRVLRTKAVVIESALRARSFDPLKRFLQALYFGDELTKQGVRHVHAHFAHQNTQMAMYTSMLTGIPFSFTGHAKDVYTADPAELRLKLGKSAFAVTCTGANVEFFRRLARPGDEGKVVLAYHGVDLEKFVPGEKQGAQEGPPLILSVGRLVAKKGYPDLLQALATLHRKGIEFRVRIMGEGPDRGELLALRDSLGLADVVEFPGACSQEDLVEMYREAALFALPCRVLDNGDRDGIPNVLMEAMATELPVVSTAVSGIPELVRHGENGLLVPERDPEALAGAIAMLLADPELRRRYAVAGRKTVAEGFSSDATARMLSELFARAITGKALETTGTS